MLADDRRGHLEFIRGDQITMVMNAVARQRVAAAAEATFDILLERLKNGGEEVSAQSVANVLNACNEMGVGSEFAAEIETGFLKRIGIAVNFEKK